LGVGSYLGGKLAPIYGIRKTAIASNCLAIFACGLKLTLNYYTIMSGKFLHGLFCGISIICVGEAFNETIPSEYL
jgi:MFS family permease